MTISKYNDCSLTLNQRNKEKKKTYVIPSTQIIINESLTLFKTAAATRNETEQTAYLLSGMNGAYFSKMKFV